MKPDERNVLVATIGIALVVVGAFLPWARIGGRDRSGLETADTFISLASGALPNVIAWVGRAWYLPAFLALAAWITTFMASHWATRTVGIMTLLVGLAVWWLFVWAGDNYRVLNTLATGPIVATIGMVLIGIGCARRRGSMLRPHSPGPPTKT